MAWCMADWYDIGVNKRFIIAMEMVCGKAAWGGVREARRSLCDSPTPAHHHSLIFFFFFLFMLFNLFFSPGLSACVLPRVCIRIGVCVCVCVVSGGVWPVWWVSGSRRGKEGGSGWVISFWGMDKYLHLYSVVAITSSIPHYCIPTPSFTFLHTYV